MTISVQRLSADQRPTLLAHLFSLPAPDRWLRFGTVLPPRSVAAYVERLDFARDAVFGVYDDDLSLAGAAHVAFEGPRAEIGLSVLPRRRRRGIARALFRRGAEHARNRAAAILCMQCLSANTRIMRLAQSLGMDMVSAGVETQARIELPEPSAASIAEEMVTDAFASWGGALRAFLAGWRHGRAAA
jgi:GNAT superfamily N-acetyltransferase